MRTIVWNCQGIGGNLTISSLKEQVRLHTPDIVVLLETKTRSHRYEHLKRQLNMDFLHAVEPRGLSGGLACFWKDANQVVFVIEVLVTDSETGRAWRFNVIYASTDDRVRRGQWNILKDRIHGGVEPCLVMGDFNDILDSSENEGRNYRTLNSMYDFRSFVADSHLLDLGYIGHPFTWRNRREGGFIQERLDRGLATESWINLYPNAQVLHQLLPGSDLSMLILDTTPMVRKWRKRFIFDPRWGKEERCKEVVHGCWQKQFQGSKGCQVFEKLKYVRMGILR
ncbi:PREDICTED: uncharacterized protein LOC103334459 [Prunus mume]|uniref:Uncharacterized protein LOC103334459 n=1 Tax=Prunus mume TaxID=102107 RepID=A0ABM0P815_PRUMU|nr:PREDICTED: uncharacterized protein LOC103334459 [Prunus mume]